MSVWLMGVGLAGIAGSSSCNLTKTFTRQAIGQQIDYINAPGVAESRLEKVAPSVWTFNWYFDRTLIVETEDGLVVVDPFSRELTEELVKAMANAGLERPVHTLVYTHFHLDHTRGGEHLSPRHVVCHARCDGWWARFPPDETKDVLPCTQTVQGDHTLRVGETEIVLVDLGRSHTDTMYAVFLPKQGVLYAADTVAVRALLPAGGVSVFMPDYLAALDRIEGLDFEVFVPSHFGWGRKDDFVEAAEMQRQSWAWIHQAIHRSPPTGDLPLVNDQERVVAAYSWYFDRMKERYGDWYGFDAQILPTFLNGFIAIYVGS